MTTNLRTWWCLFAFLCWCQRGTSFLTEEQCFPNENNQAVSLLSGGFNSPFLSHLSSIFRGASQFEDLNSNEKACLHRQFAKFEDILQRIGRRINSFESNSKLERILQETREILHNIRGVYKRVTRLKMFKNERIAKNHAKSACQKKSPLETLETIRHQTVNSAKMFDTIAEGTRFSLPFFDNITSVIITEVGLCALLAIECNQIELIGRASQSYINHDLADINATLIAITEALEKSRSKLGQKFKIAVPDAVQTAMEESSNQNLFGQEKANFIYEYLKTIYPFRSWTVIMYENIRRSAKSIHAQMGSETSTWFFEYDADHTVIVHAADKTNEGCAHFADCMQGKRIQDLFSDRESFELFATLGGNLELSISLLKEALLRDEETPSAIFFAIVLFRNHLTIARDHGNRFNYFENVPVSGSHKSVFIGWC